VDTDRAVGQNSTRAVPLISLHILNRKTFKRNWINQKSQEVTVHHQNQHSQKTITLLQVISQLSDIVIFKQLQKKSFNRIIKSSVFCSLFNQRMIEISRIPSAICLA
jgi:hypothetical protein